jgi:hypothetical protein
MSRRLRTGSLTNGKKPENTSPYVSTSEKQLFLNQMKILRTSFILQNQKIVDPNSLLKIFQENEKMDPSLTGHDMVKVQNNQILIFGGKQQDLGFSNKLWVYDVDKKKFVDSFPNIKNSLPNLLSFKKHPSKKIKKLKISFADWSLILRVKR